MLNTIQEHMLSLGFTVDTASQKKTTDAIDTVNTLMTKFAQHAMAEFAKAALAVLGFEKAMHSVKMPNNKTPGNGSNGNVEQSLNKTEKSATSASIGLRHFATVATKYFGEAALAAGAFATAVVGGTLKLLGGLGNQQIRMQMLARQMWTTQQQAMSFSLTLKALGANLQELYLSPTLMAQYTQLHAAATQMQTPGGYGNAIGLVQGVSLQIKQMRLEAYYALQWIGYYFIKYMQGPITNVKDVLTSINLVIIKKMPGWTQNVASVMASFMQAGIYISQALKKVYDWLKKYIDKMPGWAKTVAAAILTISIAFNVSPFGRLMLALTAVILLFDDFETYLHGGKAAFAPFWGGLMKVVEWFKKLGPFQAMIEGIAISWAAYGLALLSVLGGEKLLAAAQWLLNLAMDANPIGLLVTGIGILVGVIILLIEHWNSVKKAGTEAWDAIATAATNAWKIITTAASTAWKVVKNGFVDSLNWISTQINKVIAIADRIPGMHIPSIPLIQASQSGWKTTDANGNPMPSSGYILPSSSSSQKTTNVTIQQTNHITSNSPEATAAVLKTQFNRHLHNVRGIIG